MSFLRSWGECAAWSAGRGRGQCGARRGAGQLRQGDAPGPLELDDPVAAEQPLKVVDLVGAAGQHDGQLIGPDVDHLAAEDADELDDLGALLGSGRHGGEQELSLDRLARGQVRDRDDVDQLVELLDDLVERRGLDVDHDRDAAEPLLVGRGHGEREDVEPTPAEQPGDAREHARLVLDQHREDVVTGAGGDPGAHRALRSCSGWTTMASLEAPAGTIGNTFSKASVRKSMTTGRSSIWFALSMAGATSSGDSTRSPTHPMASAHST